MPPQLREIGFHVENHATQWHGFQHEIQFQEVVVAWIQLTHKKYPLSAGVRPRGRPTVGDQHRLKESFFSKWLDSR